MLHICKADFSLAMEDNKSSNHHDQTTNSPVEPDLDSLTISVKSLELNQIERHIFLCADQTLPKCCSKEASLEAWNYLKKRLKQLKLDQSTNDKPSLIFRTKANCLRVCTNGPIMVIYPDGVWYRNTTPEVIERIITEHLIGNKVVEEYAFLIHPLPETETGSTSSLHSREHLENSKSVD